MTTITIPIAGQKTLPIISGTITIDPSDLEVQWILSRICLACGPIAHIFQRAGYPIPKHAEEEQAQVLLWMLAMYQQHGAGWKAEGDKQLRALNEASE
jgi:hypothetical protein